MGISKAEARWEGSVREGRGVMHPAHAGDLPFSVGTRFEGVAGTNPEELIGAAHAGCFSMALAAGLGGAGHAPTRIHTAADVRLDKAGAGFAISRIELRTEAEVPGLDDAKFQQIAEETKKACPVSKALAGVEIALTAKLVKG